MLSFLKMMEVTIMSDHAINFPSNTSFLITGGAGFIGSNITHYLVNSGYKVRVLDNLSTGKVKNIIELFTNTNFEFIEGDCRDYNICFKACEKIDYVLHQAALGSVPRSIKDPISSHESNTTGTVNMIMASKEKNIKTFVYASSSSVYGDISNDYKREDQIGKQLSPYAVSKRVCEMYAKNFFDIYKIKTIGLRYFNVFGKRQNPDSEYAAVIPAFVKKILKGESPTIHGDGNQSRDFTFVDNVVIANLKACLCDSRGWGEVFNVGCGNTTTINALYGKLCDLTNYHKNAIYTEKRVGDVRCSVADLTKSKTVLGYTTQYDIDTGLALTLPWYKENLY